MPTKKQLFQTWVNEFRFPWTKRDADEYMHIVADPHDDQACHAAVAFESHARLIESHLRPSERSPVKYADKEQFAMQFNTTVKAMEHHWRCVEKILGKDPNDLHRQRKD
jgi:hypothetical protein